MFKIGRVETSKKFVKWYYEKKRFNCSKKIIYWCKYIENFKLFKINIKK